MNPDNRLHRFSVFATVSVLALVLLTSSSYAQTVSFSDGAKTIWDTNTELKEDYLHEFFKSLSVGRLEKTPLMAAAMDGDVEAMGKALPSRADVNATNDSGWTALHFAAFDPKQIRGGQLTISSGGGSGLSGTIHDQTEAKKGCVDLLLKKGASLKAQNADGDTPLAVAQSAEMVRHLVAKGADIHAKNAKGHTALHKAMALFLFAYMAEQQLSGMTNPSDGDAMRQLEALVTAGCDVNALDNNKRTPLDVGLRLASSGAFAFSTGTIDTLPHIKFLRSKGGRTSTDLDASSTTAKAGIETPPTVPAQVAQPAAESASGPQIYEVVPIAAPDSPGMIITMNYKQPLLQQYAGRDVIWRGRMWVSGAGASNVVHIMRVGDQHFNLSLARCALNPLSALPAGAMVEVRGKLASDYNVFRQYGTTQYLLFLEDGATVAHLTEQPSLPVSSTNACSLCGGVSDIIVQTPTMAAAKDLLSPFQKELQHGNNPMRLQNDQPTSYVVGLRSGVFGKDVEVPSKGSVTLYLPAGDYQVYVYFASQPHALFQAHEFTLPTGKFPNLASGELKQIK